MRNIVLFFFYRKFKFSYASQCQSYGSGCILSGTTQSSAIPIQFQFQMVLFMILPELQAIEPILLSIVILRCTIWSELYSVENFLCRRRNGPFVYNKPSVREFIFKKCSLMKTYCERMTIILPRPNYWFKICILSVRKCTHMYVMVKFSTLLLWIYNKRSSFWKRQYPP